jgi:hypothetical protein
MPKWSSLPLELIEASLAYLPLHARLYLCKTESQRTLTSVAYRRAWVVYWYPPHILDVLGGVDKCVRDYTFFKGTRRIVGGTDYIDRVRLCDLPDPHTSVYLAVDPYRRPVAVLRYTDSDDDNDFTETVTARQYRRAEIPHEVAVALFQRYTDSPRTWSFGTCYGLERMPGDSHARPEALAKVKRLLAGETVTVGYRDWLELQVARPEESGAAPTSAEYRQTK